MGTPSLEQDHHHNLIGQYRRVVIDCARPGIQILCIGHVNRQWCGILYVRKTQVKVMLVRLFSAE